MMTTDTITTELLGLQVVFRDDSDDARDSSYELIGPRGPLFWLVRNECNSHRLFSVSVRSGRPAKIGGYSWFTDEGGELRPLR